MNIRNITMTAMLASMPLQTVAQQHKSKIQVIENFNPDSAAFSRSAESVSRSVNIHATIQRLARAIKQVERWDTAYNHIVGDHAEYFWKEPGWNVVLIVKAATPYSQHKPAENLLYVVEMIKTKVDEKGNVIYGKKGEVVREGLSRKFLIQTEHGKDHIYEKRYDNKYDRGTTLLTPPAKTRAAWNDAPDSFDVHLIENKQGAQRYFHYIPISDQVFASEVIAVEKLLKEAKDIYMQYGK